MTTVKKTLILFFTITVMAIMPPALTLAEGVYDIETPSQWEGAVLDAETGGDSLFRVNFNTLDLTVERLTFLSDHRPIGGTVTIVTSWDIDQTVGVVIGDPAISTNPHGGCGSIASTIAIFHLDLFRKPGEVEMFDSSNTSWFPTEVPKILLGIEQQSISDAHVEHFAYPLDPGGPILEDDSGPPQWGVWRDFSDIDDSIATAIHQSLSHNSAALGASDLGNIDQGLREWAERRGVRLESTFFYDSVYEKVTSLIVGTSVPIIAQPNHFSTAIGFFNLNGEKKILTLGAKSFDPVWRDWVAEGFAEALSLQRVECDYNHPDLCETPATCEEQAGLVWCEEKEKCYQKKCPAFNWNMFLPAIIAGGKK
jgi:hypothetical protein